MQRSQYGWFDVGSAKDRRLSVEQRHWIWDQTSLTDKLRVLAHGDFEVQVLSERRTLPRQDEQVFISSTCRRGVKRRAIAWVREVYLICQGRPWVYARSVLPLGQKGALTRQRFQLKSRPLGEFLFSHPDIYRSSVQGGEWRWPLPSKVPDEFANKLIARRSLFNIQEHPLLVQEVFLPYSPVYQHSTPQQSQNI